MKVTKGLKQKSLSGYFGSSSPPRPDSASSRAKASPPSRTAKRKRPALSKRRAPESDPPSENDNGSTSSDVGGIAFEPQVIVVSSDGEDVNDSPKRPAATQRKVRKRRAESVEKLPVTVSSESEDTVGVPVNWKGKAKAPNPRSKRKRAVLDSDSDEDPQPRKSKLVKGVRPPTPETGDEDLLEEVEEARILESRLRVRDKRSQYQKNLEKLKRKKRGEATAAESLSSSEEEDNRIIPGARPTHEISSDASEEEEPEYGGLSGFIEEDSNQAIELPAEYSMNTYQDLMHHFKIICQLFVHLAVQPVEQRRDFLQQSLKDQYFSIPLQIARRKVTGMRDSLVTSSVWRTAFKKPLEMYPDFETVQMDFAVPNCDACRLGGRMSTLTGRCFGEPYDRLTFESLSESDTGDDEDEEETSKKEFNLGRFCARRTRVFHKFTHWEYALFRSLNQEVEDLRNRSSKQRVYVPVAYASGSRPPDDLSDADGIMNWFDERGLISAEWQKMKEMMESARNLEVASKRGEDDD
ncbi:uncharacterized protein PHACADRAFT_256297 [Phanerochaete carnosa HHB-10118-sp]|uniref:DUF4211 domain-containing protein n=1 Tax=Phanerochaete carnosa (strain HHB-10118-sp) TaxID=650164 RepID=K5W9C7_PHACS|nr:uncharacterized protein PHACADRAFT_256297 [Phanerochaete carnosa HHB-10118-sp]EKM55579.1 hypothetical protein PHACADRAFT_256297 [Phanerochaete carnosa HHB-10118-sp]